MPLPRVMVMDYGVGNIHSLVTALATAGAHPVVTDDPRVAMAGDALVLPGVGAFTPAADVLARERVAMRRRLLEGYPTLGICLGMQLLFESSEEGAGEGLGVIPGHVTRLRSTRLPQIGWNQVQDSGEPLLRTSHLQEGYYANSFVCRPAQDDVVTAWSEHDGDRFPAMVRYRRIVGVQFHPEKSSTPGIAMLGGWVAALSLVSEAA